MGGFQTKEKNIVVSNENIVESLKNKIRLLQGEVHDVLTMRDAEIQAYEREMMVFAFKEAEWKKERKKLREEVKKMRKKFEDRERRFLAMEKNGMGGVKKMEKEGMFSGSSFLFEQIKEEKARRDDAVEKWKQLYFSIKTELDDLIQRTNQEAGLCCKAEEEEAMLEELQKELTDKEETMKRMEAQITFMKQQESKREREVDILRQSLRIMCYNKKVTSLEKKVPKVT